METQKQTRLPEIPKGVQETRVIGPPGCGKTMWLRHQVSQAVDHGESVVVCSLTRAAALELSGREMSLDPRRVGTLHSLAFQCLGKPDLAQVKVNLEDWNNRYPYYAMTPVDVGLAEIYGDWSRRVPTKPGDALMREYEIHRARLTTDLTPRLNVFANAWSTWKRERDLLDFTDMIEMSLQHISEAPGLPRMFFVDECQDLSTLEWGLVRKWGRTAGCLVAVGDPDQAIYDWRGADPHVFLDPTVANHHRETLRQSYRVPATVHVEAVRWISRILDRTPMEYLPRPEAGRVTRVAATRKSPDGAIADARTHLAEGKSVMFLASCGYMLVHIIRRLKEGGIPFHNLYRPQAAEWNPLRARTAKLPSWTDRIMAFMRPSLTGVWTAQNIRLWGEALWSEGAPSETGAMSDRTPGSTLSDESPMPVEEVRLMIPERAFNAALEGDLEWLSRNIPPSKVASARYPLAIAMHSGLEALRQKPRVTVGTIHSAKGGEADIVYLFPDLSGAGMRQWHGGHVAMAAIIRMFYVGITRAKEQLVLCEPGGRKSVWF